MASKMVMVDGIPFPPHLNLNNNQLSLMGHGITDVEIHFLQIKYTAIGVYLDPEIVSHLSQFKGKTPADLSQNEDFFEAIINAPVDKILRVVVIKEIKGSQYGVQLESGVRDFLAEADKFDEEEEAALEKVEAFFQSKYLKTNYVITFTFPAANTASAKIVLTTEEKDESGIDVENANVVEMMKKWYLGGTRAVSPSTISSLVNTLSI
ncbi:unnamed protein product [Cuscuta epithymum]|uniref:Chalcone-flavonone isomerase family protein n=2 Tax=Cuscuta epithymum TaxID=186058 RepID=A0AAV0FVP2_9ASTE|nr:unnamed protein product [Cuscuta epithymum]